MQYDSTSSKISKKVGEIKSIHNCIDIIIADKIYQTVDVLHRLFLLMKCPDWHDVRLIYLFLQRLMSVIIYGNNDDGLDVTTLDIIFTYHNSRRDIRDTIKYDI